MIVNCQGCGTRFRSPKIESVHATGECSVCHADVLLVPSRKPYLLVQAGGLKPVVIGMDDPSLAKELSSHGVALNEATLQPFESQTQVAGDRSGPMFDDVEASHEDLGAALTASEAAAEGPGFVARMGQLVLPPLGLGTAAYYVAGPLGWTASIGGQTWMWVVGATALGSAIGVSLIRWKSKKKA